MRKQSVVLQRQVCSGSAAGAEVKNCLDAEEVLDEATTCDIELVGEALEEEREELLMGHVQVTCKSYQIQA